MKGYLIIGIILSTLIGLIPQKFRAQEKLFSLEDCINYALEKNTDIGRANNQVKSQASYLEQSKAERYPNLFMNGSGNISSGNSYVSNEENGGWANANSSSLNLSLNSSVTLYNGLKLKNTISLNKTQLSAAKSDIETKKELIELQVLYAYVGVLQAKEQLKNSEEQLNLTEKQVERAKTRKEIGALSPSDYLNVKSQYASDKANFITVQNDLRIKLVTLMQIMNMPVNDSFNIQTPNIEALLLIKQETNPNKVYNIAVGTKTEVKTAQLDVESADIGVKIAKADALPILSLNGSLATGYNNNLSNISFGEQFSKQVAPAIGLSLYVPVFQRKQVKTKVTQAKLNSENYQYDLIDVKNNLRKSIEQACIDAETANSNYQTTFEQLQAEQESYRLAEEMFTQGMVSSIDYLASKNNLTAAENELTNSKYNVILQNKVIDYYLGNSIKF